MRFSGGRRLSRNGSGSPPLDLLGDRVAREERGAEPLAGVYRFWRDAGSVADALVAGAPGPSSRPMAGIARLHLADDSKGLTLDATSRKERTTVKAYEAPS